jgi:hypothetical protein
VGGDCIYIQDCIDTLIQRNNFKYSGYVIDGIDVTADPCSIGLNTSVRSIVEYNTCLSGYGNAFDPFREYDSVIRYNYIVGVGGGGCSIHGKNLKVHHNIFVLDKVREGEVYGITAGTYPEQIDHEPISNIVFNNLFYKTGNYGIKFDVNLPDSPKGFAFRNNIIVSVDGHFTRINDNFDIDYTCYWTIEDPPNPSWRVNNTYYTDFASYQTARLAAIPDGKDQNSFYADPKLASEITGVIDFVLANDSPCIDTAINLLGNLLDSAYDLKDFGGSVITDTQKVSMGAYDFPNVGF